MTRTREQLRQIAIDIRSGAIFTSAQIPMATNPTLIRTVFTLLPLMSPDAIRAMMDDGAAVLYGHTSTSAMTVNGYPCLMDLHYLTTTEYAEVRGLIDSLAAAEASIPEPD